VPQLKPIRGTFLPKPDSSPEGRLIASLTGCWLMNEGTGSTVFDLSGNSLNGTSSGSYSRGAGGFGSGWIGDGGTNQIQVISSQSAGGILNPKAVTVLAWVKTNTGTSDQDIASLWKVGDAANQSYLLWIDQPVWEFIIRTSGGAYAANSANNVAANQFVQVVGTYDGQAVRLYINGIEVGSDTSASGDLLTISAAEGFFISERLGQQDREFDGTIDHVMLFNRALSASEIALLYREPFCMFGQRGRPQFSSGSEQIVSLAGASAGVSSLSGTVKAIRKLSGIVAGISDNAAILSADFLLAGSVSGSASIDGHLSIAGESPTETETGWRREALFNGMTADSFKLGTVLSLGWFWVRSAGCSVLYRGSSMAEIDFTNILVVSEPDDYEISPPGYVAHSSGTTYFYVVRRFNGCGYQENTLAAAVKVSIDSNGELAEPTPNKVFDSIIGPVEGNKIRLVWFYCPIKQGSLPVSFNVYYDGRTGQIDYQNSLAKISYKGRRFYSFQSSTLEAGEYLFAIRAADAAGIENSTLARLKIQLEPAAIDAINILRAEAV
jgi:hypothetical protein